MKAIALARIKPTVAQAPRTRRGNRIVDMTAHDDIQTAIRERQMRALGYGKRASICG